MFFFATAHRCATLMASARLHLHNEQATDAAMANGIDLVCALPSCM